MRLRKRSSMVLICLAVLFTLCACGARTADDPSASAVTPAIITPEGSSASSELPEDVEQALTRSPEHYDYAVLVSINPRFLLFVTEDSVIAFEALNEEARSLSGRAMLQDRPVQGALDDIVRFSYDEGYLQDGGDVGVTIVDSRRPEAEANEFLHGAESAVRSSAETCGIQVNPVTAVAGGIAFPSPAAGLSGPDGQSGQDPGDDHAPPEDDGSTEDEGTEPGEDGGEDTDPEPDAENGGGTPEGSGSESEGGVEGCSVCQGTGTCDLCEGAGQEACSTCGGAGLQPCHANCGGGYEDCPCDGGLCHKCGGTGQVGDQSCDVCGGSGMHPDCGGTGLVACPICGGAGVEVCDQCGGTGLETCPACQGTGICAACGGTGLKT